MSGPTPELDDLKWQNRVLLVFAPGADGDLLRRQLTAFRQAAPDLEERDLVVYILPAGGEASFQGRPVGVEQADALRERFNVPDPQFAVVLVGKDGTEKERWTGYAPIPRIRETIDAMPMRRREMDTRREEAP
jgi:hypothetical protein